MVPIPLFSFDIVSDTKVMPAPNSPAKPKPARNLKMLYPLMSVTKAFPIFAREYNKMEPNKMVTRPFLSPIIPRPQAYRSFAS